MKSKLLITILFSLIVSQIVAQTLLSESMGSVGAGGSATIAAHEAANGFNIDNEFTYSGTADIREAALSNGYSGASGGANVLFNGVNEDFIISKLNPTSACSITLTFGIGKATNSENGSNFVVEYTTTGGSTYTSAGAIVLPTGTGTSLSISPPKWHLVSLSLPNNVEKISFKSLISSDFRIDDITLTGVGSGCVLPVQLISFNAKPIGNNVMLDWETASEINSAYFEVQRSTDMSEFISLKRIDAANNSNEKRWYSFEDENLPQGIYYYRLRQVDFDGKATNYKALAINISDDTPSILTYPNPVSTANNMVYVKMYNINPENVLLINSQGQQIGYSLKQDSANTYILTPNTNIAGCIYYLKTMATNQEILISKIVFN